MTDGFYEIDEAVYRKEEWISKNVEEFFDMVRALVKEETFVNEIAADLAFAYTEKKMDQTSHFYDAYGITNAHAVCVLDYFYDCWKKEIDQEWEAFETRHID